MAFFLCTGIFFAWAMLVAAGDIRMRRVPNVLVLFGLGGAIASALAHANPFGISFQQALIGMLAGLIGLFPFFALRVMGAADVKVFAVIGAWCGLHGLLWIWIMASVAAGIHALALVVLSGTSLGTLWQRRAPSMALGGLRATPYAACLTGAAALWFVHLVAGGVR